MDNVLTLSDKDMWTTIAAFFLPWIIAVITKRDWSTATKGWVSFGVCVLVALGDAFFWGGLTGKNMVHDILLVVVVTVVSYKALWKPTGIADAIDRTIWPGTAQKRGIDGRWETENK